MKGIFAAWLLALPVLSAHAQTIYKCVKDGVPVYSQQPCATKPGSSQKIKLPPPHRPHADDLLRSQAAEARFDAQMRQSALARQESACINAMTGATRKGTQHRIDAYQRQIDQAEQSMGYSANNLAGAVRSKSLQERVASLRASIANEKDILASTELNARTICAQKRAAATNP